MEDLEGLLKKWQHRLRLQNWGIVIKWARGHEMAGDDAPEGMVMADIRIDPEHQRAVIRVRDRNDVGNDTVFLPTVEEHIIHELLHLHFGNPDTKLETEVAINAVATALIEADRLVQQLPPPLPPPSHPKSKKKGPS